MAKAVEVKKVDGTMTLAELEARVGGNAGAREGPATRTAWARLRLPEGITASDVRGVYGVLPGSAGAVVSTVEGRREG